MWWRPWMISQYFCYSGFCPTFVLFLKTDIVLSRGAQKAIYFITIFSAIISQGKTEIKIEVHDENKKVKSGESYRKSPNIWLNIGNLWATVCKAAPVWFKFTGCFGTLHTWVVMREGFCDPSWMKREQQRTVGVNETGEFCVLAILLERCNQTVVEKLKVLQL